MGNTKQDVEVGGFLPVLPDCCQGGAAGPTIGDVHLWVRGFGYRRTTRANQRQIRRQSSRGGECGDQLRFGRHQLPSASSSVRKIRSRWIPCRRIPMQPVCRPEPGTNAEIKARMKKKY